MRITKYRTAAIIYPFETIEAQVVDGNKIFYSCIDVREGEKLPLNGEEIHDNGAWSYERPLDQITDEDLELGYVSDRDEDVYVELAKMWNESMVFDNDMNWKAYNGKEF